MSVLPGFEDLKAKDVLVLNANGTVLVEINGKIELRQVQVAPNGCFTTRAIEKPERDQPQPRRKLSAEQRLAMTDQGQQLLGG
jgi:hypothetical protein